MSLNKTLIVTVIGVATLAVPTGASGQHEHAASSYAHTQSDEIPTLTAEELAQLRNGDGMGLARPAELNHFPGPKHVLEMADALDLTEAQALLIEQIRMDMNARAIEKGLEIIEGERHLAALFESGEAKIADVERITSHLGVRRGELQMIHLAAHIETRNQLSADQVAKYDGLRGYAETPVGGDSPSTPLT